MAVIRRCLKKSAGGKVFCQSAILFPLPLLERNAFYHEKHIPSYWKLFGQFVMFDKDGMCHEKRISHGDDYKVVAHYELGFTTDWGGIIKEGRCVPSRKTTPYFRIMKKD